MNATGLTTESRTTLAALADVLIPAWGEMPAASAIGVHERWVDRVLAARPDFGEPLAALLAEAEGRDPRAEIGRLIKSAPDRLEALFTIITQAYYMSPRVRKRLRYPGQKPSPFYPDEADWDLRNGLLDPVIDRGPIYRPTDYHPDR
jgi:hypothetical protein